MSKAQLTKELKQLSHEQLEQLILDVYGARKEAREYFEFFLNPDVEKLYTKYESAIIKETQRNRRGYSKARISKIRTMLKEFESFCPGADYMLKLLYCTINYCVLADYSYRCTEAFMNGVEALFVDMLRRADANLCFEQQLAKVDKLLNMRSISGEMRTRLSNALSHSQTL